MKEWALLAVAVVALYAWRGRARVVSTASADFAARVADIVGPDPFTALDPTPVKVLAWPSPGKSAALHSLVL